MSGANLQFFSLRTKLLVFAAALVLVPGGLYGLITVSQSRAAIAGVVGRQLVEEARSTADRLATTLRSEQGRLESFAVQDVMREIRIGDLDKRISSFLVSAKRGCPACVDLLVLDPDDRAVAASDPAWIGRTREATLGGNGPPASIAGPLRLTEGRSSILRFTVAVPDPDAPSSRLGRLVALVDWERGTSVAARARENLVSVGLDADVLIVDPRGTVIGGAARRDARWEPGAALGSGRLDAPDALSTGRVDAAAGMLFGVAPLPGPLPPWRIVVAQPLAEAFAPVDRTARLLATALGATLLAALAVALFAARRVTGPLAELTAAAGKVGRGSATVPIVPARTRDEIGTLAAAFNRMSVDLRRAEHELVEAAKFAFVGELAAGVAHEVRTPLGVLRSSAQLLERSLAERLDADPEARELLQILRDEVDRIERVVSGLLELGRPRELRAAPSPLHPIVAHAAEFVAAQARGKGVAIRCEPPASDPPALCDSELIYQVALNLLVNAVQILPAGGSVEIAVAPPRNGHAAFEVRDDGPGMSAEIRERIFEPFYTRREGGAGLGLTFVQRVVQEHRGRIVVDSVPGRGTAFRVELPLAEDVR